MDSVRIGEWRLVCKECGTPFTRVEFGIGDYGTFAYQTQSGERAFLFSLEDPVFDEVKDLFDDVLAGRAGEPLEDHVRHDALLEALVLTVDPAASGEEYFESEKAPCPRCGSTSVRVIQAPEDAPYIDVPAESVTHRRWAALSEDEKRSRIRSVIDA
jgi:hypothetical protein